MKKNLLLLALAFIGFQVMLQANTVSVETAQSIALNFFKMNTPETGRAVSANLSYTQTENDGVVDFYVFNLAPVKGFVIVAGSDNVQPVIGWSKEAYFNANATTNGVSDWMKSTAAKIHYGVLGNIPANAKTAGLWNAYINNQNPNTTKAGGIGPLCATTWNQEPYYNSLCPLDTSTNTHAVTGCVATTMAQIMKYWNYPTTGTGTFSYDDSPNNYSNTYGVQSVSFAGPFNWAGMPNVVNTNTSPVDTLMYICGVSVAMDYGTDAQGGSGAFVLQSEAGGGTNPCAQHSYAAYFNYNPNTLQGVRLSTYSTVDWINLMENELNNGRVIQYEGDDPTAGGHTWVCDGYETNGMLHMNWGWGGASNGYFAVGDLSAGGYTFSQNDGALIGIEPMLPVALSISAASPAICSGGNTTLTATGPAGATYTWTPATGLSCTTCTSPVANPSATTLYQVTVDSAGVQATAALAIVITPAVTANFTQVALPNCSLPENVTFTNTSTNGTSYTWDFGDGTTSTASSPQHPYTSHGLYTVMLFASNACGVDSLIKVQAVNITGGPPVSADKNICAGQTISLTATGLSTIGWYTAATNGTEITTGTGYTTPALNHTTTYYLGSTITANVVGVGPAANTIGSGSYYTRTTKRGMLFNCTVAQKLISVDVYADSTGKRSIILQDSLGNTLDSTSVTITAGHRTITLNWNLPVGTKLLLGLEGYNNLYRNNSGVTFPYTSADGTVTITGNTSNSPSSYYYFYNWKLQQSPCQSIRTPVTVFVLGTGGGSFVATGTGTPVVNFAPADTDATTYTWNFGDGGTSTDKFPTYTYSANGTYTVQLIVSNGSCSDTTTQTISTVQLAINELSAFSNFNLFPNPAKNQLTLAVSSNNVINNCVLSVRNILGETVYTTNSDIAEGNNNLHVDVSHFAAGVYIVSLESGKDVINTRFVKTNE